MQHYDYTKTLKGIWEEAVALYAAGNTNHSNWFNPQKREFLASIGMSVQELFDFAEDYNDGGEPDFATVALIQDIRRSYFLDVMDGKPCTDCVEVSELPAKDAELDGIAWLPRILPKARAKLQGAMPPELMYCCGGDRRFFKTNDIHPAEFLRVVAANFEDDAAILAWVKARIATKA